MVEIIVPLLIVLAARMRNGGNKMHIFGKRLWPLGKYFLAGKKLPRRRVIAEAIGSMPLYI